MLSCIVVECISGITNIPAVDLRLCTSPAQIASFAFRLASALHWIGLFRNLTCPAVSPDVLLMNRSRPLHVQAARLCALFDSSQLQRCTLITSEHVSLSTSVIQQEPLHSPALCLHDNDNDNDNDTLREVPRPSNEGLALQARVSGS